MDVSRRRFLGAAAGLAAGAALPARGEAYHGRDGGSGTPGTAPSARTPSPAPPAAAADRFDPWIEVDPGALEHNVSTVSRLAGGRPVLAVVKNNAYGLGTVEASRILEEHPAVTGLAVVKTEAALALRSAGIRKPVLLMAMASDEETRELVAEDVRLAVYTDDAPRRLAALAGVRSPLGVQLYLDTGMSRMGMPYHRAAGWMAEVAAVPGVRVEGTFTGFTEDPEFDREQLRRLTRLTDRVRAAGTDPGRLHAASSHAVFHFPGSHLDQVRPGMALYGAYPADWPAERAMATLRPAVRLRARVVRVERLRAGDSVSYGRNFVAEEPTWVATIPVGHTDGYPRRAVDGGRVLIGGATWPVIGAVSASHTIVDLGPETPVQVGDVATLVGPDHPDVHPNALASATGVSVYDVLMHLSPALPRFVLEGR